MSPDVIGGPPLGGLPRSCHSPHRNIDEQHGGLLRRGLTSPFPQKQLGPYSGISNGKVSSASWFQFFILPSLSPVSCTREYPAFWLLSSFFPIQLPTQALGIFLECNSPPTHRHTHTPQSSSPPFTFT